MVRPIFKEQSYYGQETKYQIMPFRFIRIPGVTNRILVTSEVGEYIFVSEEEFTNMAKGCLQSSLPIYKDLLAKHIIYEGTGEATLRMVEAKYRTKKSFLNGGAALHIFVVSLRCDHSCHYCQVSRQSPDKSKFDMSPEIASASIDRLFDSPSDALTIEFQGGEPLLAFPIIRMITEEIIKRNKEENRSISFTLTSTLHYLDNEMTNFFREHDFHISTSLDGPEWLHNANRPNPTKDSYQRTIKAIEIAREQIGINKVAALTTLTRRSLDCPKEIVDAYIDLGFRSIFLRPLSPYGFAVKSERKIGYNIKEFIKFYELALAYIIQKNLQGHVIDEAYTAILLTHIMTPFPSRYVDLRSPTGSGLGVLVYNYDGSVYASDEGRMLIEMGNSAFRLGNVNQPYNELMSSEAIDIILAGGIAESHPGCADCAFLPYCGADPVFHLARNYDPIGHRANSEHCSKHMGIFNILFRYLEQADPDIMRIFLAWITNQDPSNLQFNSR
jgi:His-Xaa-Ser system radical SAM maturase HxsB